MWSYLSGSWGMGDEMEPFRDSGGWGSGISVLKLYIWGRLGYKLIMDNKSIP